MNDREWQSCKIQKIYCMSYTLYISLAKTLFYKSLQNISYSIKETRYISRLVEKIQITAGSEERFFNTHQFDSGRYEINYP